MNTTVSADVDSPVTGEWSHCSDDDLEAELCGVAARVAAMTCRFLLAVAEYDRRQAWLAWECHDMAGWLSWKCGISPVTAREQVRVARALERLPVLRERFAAGQVSYSQTRAIARVATAETEAQLVEWAGAMTAAQLETVTHAYRRSAAAAQETADARDRARSLTWGWDDNGNVVGQFRLPAEQAAALINALTARVERAAIDAADSEGAADPLAAVAADALVDLITAGAASDDTADGRYLVTIVAEAAVLAGANSDGICQVADGAGLAAETARRIACDATSVTIVENTAGDVVDVGRRTRRPNRRLRTALQRRDQHCQYPGCTRRRTQAHHIVHWIDGGPTTMTNMTSLCSRHHHRLHEGRLRIETSPTGQLLFYRPDGQPIPTVITPTPIANPDPDPDPSDVVDPYTSDWDGSRLDLTIIIDGLLHADGLLQTPATT